jgi:[ribosomal protein S5]-alanine N-acetyltransferase
VLAGRVNLTNVSRGPFQSASLGYWTTSVLNGRRVATTAVGLARRYLRIAGCWQDHLLFQRVAEP